MSIQRYWPTAGMIFLADGEPGYVKGEDHDAEVEHLRRLLCWVYEHHSRGGVNWALVCDEECEIAAIAEEVKR